MAGSPTVRLREPTRADLPFLRAMWADAATMAQIGGPVHLTDEEAESWFRRMVDPGRPTECFRLILDPSGAPVGEVSFHRMDPVARVADLNVKVHAASRGRGLGRRALTIFLRGFFEEQGGAELLDRLAPGNEVGRHLLESLGFEHDPGAKDVHLLRMSRACYRACVSRWPATWGGG